MKYEELNKFKENMYKMNTVNEAFVKVKHREKRGKI